jgi:hypothetical protein
MATRLSLAEYIAKAVSTDLQSFILANMDFAARLSKQIKDLDTERVRALSEAEAARILMDKRENMRKILDVSESRSAAAD